MVAYANLPSKALVFFIVRLLVTFELIWRIGLSSIYNRKFRMARKNFWLVNLVQISRNVDKTFEKSDAALAFRLEIFGKPGETFQKCTTFHGWVDKIFLHFNRNFWDFLTTKWCARIGFWEVCITRLSRSVSRGKGPLYTAFEFCNSSLVKLNRKLLLNGFKLKLRPRNFFVYVSLFVTVRRTRKSWTSALRSFFFTRILFFYGPGWIFLFFCQF